MSSVFASEVSDVLLAYVQRSIRPGDAVGFRQLAGIQGRLGRMTAAAFLLHRSEEKTQPSVHRFVFDIMPILLPQLSRNTHPERVTLHGRTRGRVDWSGTYKARLSEDTNPTVFVCLQSWRVFDRPENQLCKFLLHHIQHCLNRTLPDLGDWCAWGWAFRSSHGEPLRLGDYFASLAHRVRTFGAHVYLREVGLPPAIEGRHVLAARTSKNELYASVADLDDLYQAVVHAHDWERWADVLSQTLPLPPGADEVAQRLVL